MINSDYHTRSNYIYIVHKFVIAIKDLNLGRMSVTNNIESIFQYISEKENIDPIDYTIIYKDCDGQIDGFDWQKKDFIFLDLKLKQKCLKLIP